MIESNQQAKTYKHLEMLLGLKLSLARYAGDVRLFHFGKLSGSPEPCGQYAIHLQCPWRLEGSEGILTGLQDWYTPAELDAAVDDEWKPENGGSLQEAILRRLMNDTPGSSRSIENRTDHLTVTGILTDRFGGFCLDLSGGFHLSVFPTRSRGEQWRLLEPDTDSEHFVVE